MPPRRELTSLRVEGETELRGERFARERSMEVRESDRPRRDACEELREATECAGDRVTKESDRPRCDVWELCRVDLSPNTLIPPLLSPPSRSILPLLSPLPNGLNELKLCATCANILMMPVYGSD